VTFASCAAHHQSSHRQKSWPEPPDSVSESFHPRPNASQQILVKYEEGLNAGDLSGSVSDRKVTISELGADRILDDLVVAAILPEMVESLWPAI
jgi:hypothetical protein